MKMNLWSELDKLRGEITYSSKDSYHTAVFKWLDEFEIDLPKDEIPTFLKAVMGVSSAGSGIQIVPSFLIGTIKNLLVENFSEAESICDPFARIGSLILPLWDLIKPTDAFAFTYMEGEAYIGRILSKSKNINWQVGDPLKLIQELDHEFDVVCSIPPFGVKTKKVIEVSTITDEIISSTDDLGNLIITLACQKLKPNGIGIFVVPSSFFWSKRSVHQHFNSLGVGVNAALALPPGAFAPHTNIETYLVVIKKQVSEKMFVAQLSYDLITNSKIISNYKESVLGETLELGRIVEASSFKSINTIRIREKLEKATSIFKGVPLVLDDVATSFNLGHSIEDFNFQDYPNTVYIPLIGNNDVVEVLDDDPTLKKHNYAQVVIDPKKSYSRFIANFYNSELGKEIRELSKGGMTNPRLNLQTIRGLKLLLPDIEKQNEVLKVQALIVSEKNILMGVQNELLSIERDLWANAEVIQDTIDRIKAISMQRTKMGRYAKEHIDYWIETLPFPLSSILRSWHTAIKDNHKERHEHLLNFFEATTEFVSIVFLSAFKMNKAVFDGYEQNLKLALQKNHQRLDKASFGTWKTIAEYSAKEVRRLISSNKKEDRDLCESMFIDSSLTFPKMLSSKELIKIISATNKMRNDWKGHPGVVGENEAKNRNVALLAEVQNIMHVMADVWSEMELIQSLGSKNRRGIHDNDVAILMGSNPGFKKETRSLTTSLDTERLYLIKKDANQALLLIPFIQMAASPESARNACYFFNRYDKSSLRYVSYNYAEKPEERISLEDVSEIASLLKIEGTLSQ